jgi:ribosomal protein S18 acetylase RimI-like enzyme
MASTGEYLEAYDRQLRTDAETPGAVAVTRLGPLLLVTFPGGRGFVTYRDLGDADRSAIAGWVEEALEHYRADPAVTSVEWKTRGHDRAPGLHEALVRNGFLREETESIMIGEASLLAVDVPLPEGVRLRRVTSEPDVQALSRLQEEIFGGRFADAMADALLRRLTLRDGMELWAAEARGEIVSSGRLEPVAGTEFAGIWGGATRPEWRRRGIYRALTAARARSALALGKRLIHSDSTEGSRPILERAGLVKVSATTPYEWRADRGHSA